MQTDMKLYPPFDEKEVRRLPHLAMNRILERLERCRNRMSQQCGDNPRDILQEASRLVQLFPIINETTSDIHKRGRLVPHIVFWENWVRREGQDIAVNRLKPHFSGFPTDVKDGGRKTYRRIDEHSVEDSLKEVISDQGARRLLFQNIDFRRLDKYLVEDAFSKAALFVDCEFHGCDFGDVKIPNAYLIQVSFDGCNLEGTNMSGLRAHGIRIRNPTGIRGVKFDDAMFYDVRFDQIIEDSTRGISFASAAFADCLFQGVTFKQANFSKTSLVHCVIEESVFSGCEFRSSVFHDVKVGSSCWFAGGSLERVSFSESDLSGILLNPGPHYSDSEGRESLIKTNLSGLDCTTSFDIPEELWDRLPKKESAEIWTPSAPDEANRAVTMHASNRVRRRASSVN